MSMKTLATFHHALETVRRIAALTPSGIPVSPEIQVQIDELDASVEKMASEALDVLELLGGHADHVALGREMNHPITGETPAEENRRRKAEAAPAE